ncbi:CoxG family protein [Bacillus sp. DJP31]|uniref:CoxG family protein n=1 Tax=Bacillus sp. DJP31 TaxID=3409789 RepID=UPI003BB5322C
MNGSGSLTVNASIEKTCAGLYNTDVLVKCLMGCKKLKLIENNKYLAELSIGIPPVNGKYESIIEIEEIEKAKTYKLIITAEGDAGNVKATGLINLLEEQKNKTNLSYTFEAEVGGKVSMVGGKILNGVGKLIIQDFFKKFGKELGRI